MTNMQNLAYPDPNASLRILNELTSFFSQCSFVNRMFVFGSHARGDWDRWSDIDMLFITSNGFPDQWLLFDRLRQYKAILHHHTFTPQTELSGGNVLGIIFEDESVFHNLDLNFMPLHEFLVPKKLERFGEIKLLYLTTQDELNDEKSGFLPTFAVDVDERRIGMAIHWTKKAIKKVLRGETTLDDLQTTSLRLKEIMSQFPEDRPMQGGNICHVARTYLQISDTVLAQGVRKSDCS